MDKFKEKVHIASKMLLGSVKIPKLNLGVGSSFTSAPAVSDDIFCPHGREKGSCFECEEEEEARELELLRKQEDAERNRELSQQQEPPDQQNEQGTKEIDFWEKDYFDTSEFDTFERTLLQVYQ